VRPGTLPLVVVLSCVPMCRAFAPFLLGCAPGNGSQGTSWAVPEGVRPGTLALSVVLCYVAMCHAFVSFLVGCALVDCS